MSMSDREAVELFLQEASEHLQYLREYVSVLQEVEPRREDLERLYIAAHTLSGTSASYGFPRFSEVAGKLAHIFQYSLNATLGDDLHGPLTEFLSDGISLLETDLLEISDTGQENVEDIAAFKERYRFAFPAEPAPLNYPQRGSQVQAHVEEVPQAALTGSYFDALPSDDEVGDEILEFFQPEAEEHLQVVSDCLISLEGNNNPEEINRLFRAIHTVKGSAAQVGLKRLGAIAHRVEDLIGRLRDGEIEPSPAVVDLCLESVDVLKKTLHKQWADESDMRAGVDSLLGRIAEFAPLDLEEDAALEQASADGDAHSASGTGIAAPAEASARKTLKQGAGLAATSKSVRIALERLDRMMNTVGELVINRTRMVGRVAELEKLVDTLSFSKERLQGKVNEFQEKYEFNRISSSRNAAPWNPATTPQRLTSAAAGDTSFFDDFSELEMDRYDDFNILSRSMAEISADVNEVLTQLEGYIGRVEGDIDEFTKLAHHLQDEFTAARMVPIGTLYSRLSRAVRDAAQSAGKQVELDFAGNETELDNNIIQQISDPLVHLVRNSVAHGIERAEARLSAGKPEAGKVSLRAYHRGNHIYIEVEDDGRGIDYERVKQSAVERAPRFSRDRRPPHRARSSRNAFPSRILHRPGQNRTGRPRRWPRRRPRQPERPERRNRNSEHQRPRHEVHSQGASDPDHFARAVRPLRQLPASRFRLAVVEEIRRLRADEIEDVGGKLLTKVRDVVTEVVRLDTYLGLPPLEPINGYFRMVVANTGNRQIGLVVEEVLGKDEIVIKNLGEYLRRVKLFPGTTIAPDGSLILLIDLNRMVATEPHERRTLQASASAARVFAPGSEAVARGTIPTDAIDRVEHERVIVVADDSISVRKFVGRMLEKNGYRVKLAADGLEAAELVAQHGCHLVITDLEMPRMTGYELMVQLRQSPATRRIPVMVVTSRAGAKHRDRAIKEGAASFLTKPVQEDQLIAAVEQLIGTEATRPAVPVA